MAFYLKAMGTYFSSGKEEKLQRIQRVEEAKKQLITEGYQPSEVEHFVKLAVGSTNLNDLDNQKIEILIQSLTKQIDIARKCKRIF